MDSLKSFRVGIRRKIPYLTNSFLLITGGCFLVLILFELAFYPIKDAPDEMKAVVFYILVPDVFKKALIFSIIGLFIFSVLYGYSRFYSPALLIFCDNQISIRGRANRLTIPIETINRVYCNDATDRDGIRKGNFSVGFEYGKRKATIIKLKDYDEADSFMEELMKYSISNMQFFDFKHMPTFMEEE